jgi:PilZ domain
MASNAGKGSARDRRKAAGNLVLEERRRAERRVEQRVPIDLWVESQQGEDLYFQRLGNLSAGGAHFEKTVPHPLGTRVKLRFSLPDAPGELSCLGEIVSASSLGSEEPGMGVKFIELGADVRGRIRALVASVQGLPRRP